MSRGIVGLAASTGEASPSRRASAADIEIGARIRRVRTERRVTQEVLAERLGLSCQQVQKYENGTTRISATRLVQVARVLDAEIVALLADPPESMPDATSAADADAAVPTAQDMLTLMQAFCAIRSAEARMQVLEMAKILSRLQVS